MDLYFIENDATVDDILASPEYRAGDDVIVCVNLLPYYRLAAKGNHRLHLIEDFYTPERYRQLHEAADRFAADWYRIGERDLTLHEDVSFGAITQVVLLREFLLHFLLKYGEAIRLAHERYASVRRVIHDLSNDSNCFNYQTDDGGKFFNKPGLVRTVADQLGLQTVQLFPRRLVPPRFTSTIHRFFEPGTSFRDRFRARLRALAGTAFNVLNRLRGPRASSAVYFFPYFNIRGLLRHANQRLLVAAPTPWQIRSGARYVDMLRVRTVMSPDDASFLRRLQATFAGPWPDGGATFTLGGLDYQALVRPMVCEMVLKIVPNLLRYARQIEQTIREHAIRRMVLIDVQSDMAKTRIAVCRKLGVETVFLDHGIMGHTIALRSMSGADPEWIIKPDSFAPGRDPYPYNLTARAHTLGNPCTDPYPAHRRKRVSRIRKVLLTTHSPNFTGRLDTIVYEEAYFKELLTAIPELRRLGLELHYRPHAENPVYHRYLFDYFGVPREMVTESGWSTPFRELIYEMDLYVGSASTTFYESLAAGVPAVFLDPHHLPDAYFPPLNGRNGEDVLRVTTAGELVDLIARNCEDARELAGFMDNFHTHHARNYLYELDGEASRRIAQVAFAP